MDLAQLIRSRRTVHNYTAEKIDDRLVEEALGLSLFAPNHKLTFPWHYTWIGENARTKLAALAVDLKQAKGGPLSPVKAEAVRQSVQRPSHLISLGLKRTPEDAHRQHEDYAALACAVQIASLNLWAQGVATKWSTGGWSTHPRAYEILGVNPEKYVLEGCLMIGMAEFMPTAPERPALSQVSRKVT
jgi:nitroreductase